MDTQAPSLNITAVERETGISKDVLRKWETRYGFPTPLRDANGERLYPTDQVVRLRLIKRLMDAGLRPSKLVGRPDEELQALSSRPVMAAEPEGPGQAFISEALDLLGQHDLKALRRLLSRQLQQQGLRIFVQDKVGPLSQAVGEAWSRGNLEIHEEHLYTEVVQDLLRGAQNPLNDPEGRPRLLLTTLPGEAHSLGLLMVASVLVLGGAHCISLGAQTPTDDIRKAARAHEVDAVVLSFSAAFARRRIPAALAELRQRLAAEVEIWAGGAGTARLAHQGEGIRLLPDLAQAEEALGLWRGSRGGPAA
ncbi:MAG: cobalamin B12-binding domain-containing protein [Thiobacillus sp.]|nr:cobalamin B12-binding domain-containing protein [Thiobacillus sp.]